MANHRRPSKKKLAPSIVLLLSVASVTSPLALLFMSSEKATATPTSSPVPQFAVDMPKLNAVAVRTKAERVAPSYTSSTSARPPARQPPASSERASSQSVATARTTVSSTPPAPATTERQRATQRATSSTLTAVRHPPSTSATPVPAKAPPSTVAKAAPKQAPTTTAQKSTPTSKPTPTPTKTIEKTTDPPKALSPPSPPPPSHQLLVQIAQKYVNRGIPYQMGGNSLSGGMDCSHFVWMVLKEAGYNVQYKDSSGLSSWTKRISDPQPGDLVLFRGHVGILVGNGMMIDQGRSGGAHLSTIKYYDNFIGYGRLPI